jgi:hypothetical protein
MNKTEVTKNVNRNNAEHCVLFEAVDLIMKQGDVSLPDLRAKAIAHLSKFINIKEPNIRYLGLNAMASMLGQEGCDEAIRKQNQSIMQDTFIREHIEDLLRNIRTQVLVKLIKPYTKIHIPFIAKVPHIHIIYFFT